jgi:hypothetical protein
MNTGFEGSAITAAAVNSLAPGRYAIEDQSVWSATVRVQRSFWP